MQLADAHSRMIDDTQVLLNSNVFHHICQIQIASATRMAKPELELGLTWGYHTCDVFAEPGPHEHKAPLFFTLYACPGTLGVKALNQEWKNRAPLGKSTLLRVFPPFYLMRDLI
jgi:hypothetical protein